MRSETAWFDFGFNRANGATLDEMLEELLPGADAPPEQAWAPTSLLPPLPWERPHFTRDSWTARPPASAPPRTANPSCGV